jgi:hypothetical protein
MFNGDAVKLTNKLLQACHLRSRTRRLAPADGPIYHYTTATGLHKIVETNCLHASSAFFMNDTSELEYCRKVLADVFEKWRLDNPELAHNQSAELIYDLGKRVIDKAGREALVQSVYLACFCQRDNVLNVRTLFNSRNQDPQ